MTQEKMGSSDLELVKLKLHSVYLISGLVIAIILLATGEWTPQQKFTEYLSNAATLVSVVLGLVAIFYSFISNDSLSKSLGSISNVSEQIGQTREQMAIYVERSGDIARNSADGANHMVAASNEMKASFTELNGLLSTMHSQTMAFKDTLDQVPLRFDKIDAYLQESKNTSQKRGTSAQTNVSLLPAVNVEAFLNQASLATNFLSYAATLAHKNAVPLSVKEVASLLGTRSISQLLGILRTMHSIDLVTHGTIESSTFEIIWVHPTLEARSGEYLKEFIETGFLPRSDEKLQWEQRIKSLENSFEAIAKPDEL